MTEDDLEQVARTELQDSGWKYRHGAGIAADGNMWKHTNCRQVIRGTGG